jgi:hypothetical protein
MKPVALLLLLAPLTACFDFGRLFPDRDLGVRDQSAMVDSALFDQSLADGEDAAPSAACTQHLHDGLWSGVEYGPGGSGSSGLSVIWADPGSTALVAPYAASFFLSSDDGMHWGQTLTPTQPPPTVWAADLKHYYYPYAPDAMNTHLYEIDTSHAGADLAAGASLARDLTPELTSGSLALIAGRPGTPLVLFGGSGGPSATVLWDGANVTVSVVGSGYPVQSISVSDYNFLRGGYRFLEQSTDGKSWTPLYTLGSGALDGAISALVDAPVDASFLLVWTGRLPSGEEIYVTALNWADSGAHPQVLCWQKGGGSPSCQVLPFQPYGLWGTSCGVILVVGAQLQALRYDIGSDRFELETQTPPYTTLTDNFIGVTGHADGTALAYTDIGYIYIRR